jgi:hypothetical protein
MGIATGLCRPIKRTAAASDRYIKTRRSAEIDACRLLLYRAVVCWIFAAMSNNQNKYIIRQRSCSPHNRMLIMLHKQACSNHGNVSCRVFKLSILQHLPWRHTTSYSANCATHWLDARSQVSSTWHRFDTTAALSHLWTELRLASPDIIMLIELEPDKLPC